MSVSETNREVVSQPASRVSSSAFILLSRETDVGFARFRLLTVELSSARATVGRGIGFQPVILARQAGSLSHVIPADVRDRI